MKQEAFVILIGVLLAVAAGIAIGGPPFGGGGNDVLVSATTAPVDAEAPTTVPVSVAPETTVPEDSVHERVVLSTSPTTTTSPGSASTPTTATTIEVAAAGPIPTTDTTQPEDWGESDDSDELRDRDSLLVTAVNASGLDGVSESKAADLEAAGYVGVVAVDAVQPSATSAIYFAPGLDREVFLVTADLAWDGVELSAMALAPEIESPGEFDLLVLIGSDRATPALQP